MPALETRTPSVPGVFDRALAGGVPKPDVWTTKRKPKDLARKHRELNQIRAAKKERKAASSSSQKQKKRSAKAKKSQNVIKDKDSRGVVLGPLGKSDLASMPVGGFGIWGGIIDFDDEVGESWALQLCSLQC